MLIEEEKEIKLNALKLAVEYSIGYNHHVEDNAMGGPGNKCNSDDVMRIVKKFEIYLRGENA